MEWKKLWNEYKTIIIHRHEKPDGDALGSQIGLKLAILETFPDKDVFAVGDTSEHIKFIGEMDSVKDEQYKDALVFVLDTGAEYLISDKRYNTGEVVVKIDHHIPQGTYGDIKLVNTKYESCAGLIAHFIKKTYICYGSVNSILEKEYLFDTINQEKQEVDKNYIYANIIFKSYKIK